MKDQYDVIDTIVLSEKATILKEESNKYVFKVNRKANKIQIKRAIEQIFKKKVIGVNTANYDGKKKREKRADSGRAPHWKKAVVTLGAGEKIDII